MGDWVIEIALLPIGAAYATLRESEGTHLLVTEGKKDGNVLGRGTYAVSKDGHTLTATVAGTDAAGKAFDQVIVFDRG